MKQIFIITCIIFSAYTSKACEICGCGVGNYYMGLSPQFSRSFMGVRYQFSSFHTSIKNDPSQHSNELFQSLEVWGGINIGKKWQLIAIVPFSKIRQVSDDGTFKSNGIGDVAVMGNYTLFTHSNATAHKQLITQQLAVGAGIKLATGKFNVNLNDPALTALANTQSGSGSTDFMLNAIYNISVNRFGVSTSARYKINTTNYNQYFFGNQFSANSFTYYSFTKGKTNITPNVGLLYQHSERNYAAQQKIAETGGYLLSTAAGVEVSINKITIGANAQLPLSQNFASAQTRNTIKGMMHLSFSF